MIHPTVNYSEPQFGITVIPNRTSILSWGISVKCKPLLSDEHVLYDSKFELDVK